MRLPILIRPFEPHDQRAAKALILAGLAAHWGELDPNQNPDLADIGASYGDGLFLVAYLGAELVGTGAFVPLDPITAEIKRMSVAAHYQRQGIGRLLLDHLIRAARKRGYRQIVLETTATWQQAITFYQKAGFHLTHITAGDAYFVLKIRT